MQTLGDASPHAAFTNKVRIFFHRPAILRLLLFRHNILDPIEGDDWNIVAIIAATSG
jgi:hypothetical protein